MKLLLFYFSTVVETKTIFLKADTKVIFECVLSSYKDVESNGSKDYQFLLSFGWRKEFQWNINRDAEEVLTSNVTE